MTDALLELRAVHRDFTTAQGVHRAVRGLDLEVGPGEVVAVLGPNGAGKTTTVKMAATLLVPTSGEVFLAGVDAVARPDEARRHLGLVLGGDRGFYGRASARENLDFFAALQRVDARSRRARVTGVLEIVGLGAAAHRRVETFSRGMRQRLHLARAILAEPALLLLDEPSLGLDPEGARDLHDLVVRLRGEGRGVLLTSHHLVEVERLADRIVVVSGGRVAFSGTASAIARHVGISAVRSMVVSSRIDPTASLAGLPGVVEVLCDEKRGAWSVDLLFGEGAPFQHQPCLPPGIEVLSSVSRAPTLEEAYLALVASEREREQHPGAGERGEPC